MNWNDLRHVLALSRGRTLSGAARLLGVDDTTVARRLAAVQKTLGVRLYQRLPDATLQLTSAGARAALQAERIEREIGTLHAALSGADDLVSGTVRVTSVPVIVNHLLIPASRILLERHPQLALELVGDARDLSLTRREADLALRLARPKTGGTQIKARRVGTLRYASYAMTSCSPREARLLPWITYEEAMAHLPQARWIASYAVDHDERISSVRVNDAEAVLEAVVAGLGRSLLPCVVADREPRLRKLAAKTAIPSRELWLLVHSELRTLGRIEAVIKWIEETVPR
jgi:DNA-binding transcriptional LysR family regulator